MGRFREQSIGMDIDRRAIKAVQVSGTGGNHTLQHVGYHALPPGVIAEGEVADHDLLAAEIREFWSSHSFRGSRVFLGIANQQVVVRQLDFPRMDPDDLRSAISFEAQEHIPMPVDDAYIDHVVLGPTMEGSNLDRILIVAAQKDMIGRYTSALRTAGLRAAGVDVSALSLTRSTLPDSFFDEGDILLFDVGSELSNLVICQNGNPTLTRFTPGGYLDFIRAVAGATNLPEEEAERYMLNPRINLGEEEDPDSTAQMEPIGEDEEFDPDLLYDARRGLEDAAQTLADDVQRSIDYHHTQPGAREVSQVFVSGEGALVSGLDRYLGELLGIPTFRGNPLQKIVANRSNVSDEQLRVMEPVLAISLGLALEDT